MEEAISLTAPTRSSNGVEAPARVPALDGLRGLAILTVMLYHFHLFGVGYGSSLPLWERLYSSVANVAWVGVDLFFVLSGFLITGILHDSRQKPNYYATFYRRRALRIFPLYYLMLVLAYWVMPMVLRGLHEERLINSWIAPSSQIYAWTYLLNWRMAFWPATFLFRHFWSLSIEEQFYLVWPLVVRKLSARKLTMVCAGLVLTALGLRVTLHLMNQPWAAYVLTFSRTDALALGAVLALAIRNPANWAFVKKIAPYVGAAALAGLLVQVALTGMVVYDDFWMGTIGITLVAVFFGAFVAMTLAAPQGSVLRRFTTSPILRFFGKYSYGMYCFHQPIAMVLARVGLTADKLTPAMHSRFLAVAAVNGLALATTILFALASWNLLEKHFLKLKDLPQFQPQH
jgi:peptidoglycan/LPS O-acetylase OafA/YrhL